MIKIVLLLTFICFSCEGDCNQYNGIPKKAKDCVYLEADTDKDCCYYEYQCKDQEPYLICQEKLKDKSAEQERSDEESVKKDCKVIVKCTDDTDDNSSYLKIGILLIIGLLF